ncbi:MAG: hypothetical protein ACI8QC_001740 [Planctomycetota bacterium]|jgi:hypothetical protein
MSLVLPFLMAALGATAPQEPEAPASPSEQVGRVLRRLVEEHPQHASLVPYGVSAAGRPLLALRVQVVAGELGGPSVAVVGSLGRADNGNGVLGVLRAELHALKVGGEVQEAGALPMQDRLWIPLPDPDALEGADLLTRTNPAFDFPVGWDAWSAFGPAGPYPYSTPEAAALGRLLEQEHSLASLILLAPVELADTATPGSLARFASERLLVRSDAVERDLGARLVRLDLGRPRLELVNSRRRCLGGERWLVEFTARNVGMDDLNALAPLPSVGLGGGRVLAVAWSEGGDDFAVSDVARALAGLGAGAERELRVVIESNQEQDPILELFGPRWRTVRRGLQESLPTAR